jgi:enterochelin esterase-like enzyme
MACSNIQRGRLILSLSVCLLALGCDSAVTPPESVRDAGSGTGGSSTGGALGTGGAAGMSGTGGSASGGSGGVAPEPDAGTKADASPEDVAPPADGGGMPRPTKPGTPPIADGTEYNKLAPYPLPPEAASVAAGVPRGQIINFNTPRNWTLYVPMQYDATKPAAFMVFQDGPLYGDRNGTFRTPNVLDNLIAKGELPVMLAAFIPATGQRSVDYDSLNDKYVTFVLTQILPMVEARYKITKNPEGRGLGGQSSGGIAAFTAAWQRPDQFRRVLSDNGSFTALQNPGGNTYPDLLRTTPVKPLRVTLVSSTNDAGSRDMGTRDWLQANKNMAAALKERGYQYIFMTGNGAHYPPVQGASVHPMHMKWLWWDYTPDGT